jgi:hypothetical protein
MWLVGKEKADKPVRYFITKNADLADHITGPEKWKNNAFMNLKSVRQYEDQWETVST